jgi:hypothetical protein
VFPSALAATGVGCTDDAVWAPLGQQDYRVCGGRRERRAGGGSAASGGSINAGWGGRDRDDHRTTIDVAATSTRGDEESPVAFSPEPR